MSVVLSQEEADRILAAPKRFTNMKPLIHMKPRHEEQHDLIVDGDPSEILRLHINRKSMNPLKVTFHLRLVAEHLPNADLCRLDMHGPPHVNPDGEEIPTPHLHWYRQGYGDLWAELAPTLIVEWRDDIHFVFQEFLRLINVVTIPNLQPPLGE